jgi:hypothetical protein
MFFIREELSERVVVPQVAQPDPASMPWHFKR